ncbi:MAG: GNAT family N-acetyltransferase [Alphaproteobacteria bacterium]
MGDRDPDVLSARTVASIGAVPAAAWDACAGAANPFVAHAFLAALEDSKSVAARAGWNPRHVVVEDAGGAIAAVAPLYVKTHSQGEYVFDHGWADAFERAGGAYYPKLQVAVPFTPVPGPRLLVRPGPDAPALRRALARALIDIAEQAGVSSLHVTFADEPDRAALADTGLLIRDGYQYHWANPGYASFEDFLGALKAAKRKLIRRERRAVADAGITIAVLTGAELRPAHWDAFFAFYQDTGGRKWGRPYLTRAFFDRIGQTMADRVALVLATHDGHPVAGALNMIGTDALYGRYWGCLEDHRFLHFEACYYRAIDFAIEHRLARVEAGAQGEHKLARGYLPRATWSGHWIAHPGFRVAVADFLARERAQVAFEIRALSERHSPYRAAGGS